MLFRRLDLIGSLGPELPDLVRRTFTWVCDRLELPGTSWTRLVNVTSAAFAWRQMVFYLSLVSATEIETLDAWLVDHLEGRSAELRARFSPALTALRMAMRPEASFPAREAVGAKRFLGWAGEPHWLLT